MSDINLYKKPVFVVYYKGLYHRESFELKTLAGCHKRIVREGLENFEIYKVTKHLYDWSQNKKEFVERKGSRI